MHINNNQLIMFHWRGIVVSNEKNGAMIIPPPIRRKCNDDQSTAANEGKNEKTTTMTTDGNTQGTYLWEFWVQRVFWLRFLCFWDRLLRFNDAIKLLKLLLFFGCLHGLDKRRISKSFIDVAAIKERDHLSARGKKTGPGSADGGR